MTRSGRFTSTAFALRAEPSVSTSSFFPLCPLSHANLPHKSSFRSSFSSYCSAAAFSRSWHAWQPSCVHPSATEAPHLATKIGRAHV